MERGSEDNRQLTLDGQVRKVNTAERRANARTAARVQAQTAEVESEYDYYNIPLPSRRVMQKGGLIAVGVAAGLGIGSFAGYHEIHTPAGDFPNPMDRITELSHLNLNLPDIHLNLPDLSGGQAKATVKTPEKNSEGTVTDLSLSKLGLSWTPDGHITYFTTTDGHKRYFISSNVSTYMIETNGNETLEQAIQAGDVKVDRNKPVIAPDKNSDWRRDYVGITSVLQVDSSNPNHLYALAHGEKRANNDGGSFTASVGLLESNDGGLSWTDKGALIKGDDPQEPGKDVSGAGQPAAIYNKDNGYVYVMYVDWTRVNYHHADQVYMTRMKVNNGTLGQLEYWTTDGQFENNFDPSKMQSVITPPSGSTYAALPNLSYNSGLGGYLCVFEGANGFYATTSQDLVNWSSANEVFDFNAHGGKNHNDGGSTADWITYPSYLSDATEPNDEVTDEIGDLYFADAPYGNAHNLKETGLSLKQI